MKSDGGFANDRIRASNALLSGPAGGLIGYSKLIPTIEKFPQAGKVTTVIGLDMGGTSTDVSKFLGSEFEHTYSFSINGIEINTPHLQIDTIAAGGGSKLTFVNGLFQVGPESVGSDPGPACYGIGDELAITDANIVLNRLDLDNFPKVFGKSRNEKVNPELSHIAFSRLAEVINKEIRNPKSVEEIALGYVEMGNEMMARSVRKLYSTGKPEVLIVFGSAGGQHACGIAEKIGVDKVFIHKYSGVLSAYGLSKSDIVEERKRYLGTRLDYRAKHQAF